MQKRRLDTENEIFQFLLGLKPDGREYEPVKRFIAMAISEPIAIYKENQLPLPPEMRNVEQYVIDSWDKFAQDQENKNYELERKILNYGKRIYEIENNLAGELGTSSVLELLDRVEADAKNDQIEDFICDYVKQVRDEINNREYISIDGDTARINKGVIMHFIRKKLGSMPVEQVYKHEITKMVYKNWEKEIEKLLNLACSGKKEKRKEKIKEVNKIIDEEIDGIQKELVEYFHLKIILEPFCSSRRILTDEEIISANLKENFNQFIRLYEELINNRKLSEREIADGKRMEEVLRSRLYRPYSFISVVEENGQIYATISGHTAHVEFLEYVQNKLLEMGYDNESVNLTVGNALRKIILYRFPLEEGWEKVESHINGIVEKTAITADIESTRNYCYSLIEKAETCSSINKGILLAKEMECLLVKMQNSIYSDMAEDFRNAYACYLRLIDKTVDKVEESSLNSEEKYSVIKRLALHLHYFGDGGYEDVEHRINHIKTLFAKDMFGSIGDTRIVKHKIRFGIGAGMGIAGTALIGFGLAFMPIAAIFGLATIPIGMKLVKDGVSELKQKHNEFVRGKKAERKELNKETV